MTTLLLPLVGGGNIVVNLLCLVALVDQPSDECSLLILNTGERYYLAMTANEFYAKYVDRRLAE